MTHTEVPALCFIPDTSYTVVQETILQSLINILNIC